MVLLFGKSVSLRPGPVPRLRFAFDVLRCHMHLLKPIYVFQYAFTFYGYVHTKLDQYDTLSIIYM